MIRAKLIRDVFGSYRNPLDRIEKGTATPTHNAKRKGIIYKKLGVADPNGWYISLDTAGSWRLLSAS